MRLNAHYARAIKIKMLSFTFHRSSIINYPIFYSNFFLFFFIPIFFSLCFGFIVRTPLFFWPKNKTKNCQIIVTVTFIKAIMERVTFCVAFIARCDEIHR